MTLSATRPIVSVCASFGFVASTLLVGVADAGVLNDPSEFTIATTKIDFEAFPDGASIQYGAGNVDDEWLALGVLIEDDTAGTGASAFAATYSIQPHSGTHAIADSTNSAGGWVRFVFSVPASEAGIWVQNGDAGSTVEFYDAAGGLIAQVSVGFGDVFAGYAASQGIGSMRITDGDFYMVDDVEFGACATAQPHGHGCPGSGGFTPSFAIGGCTLPGAPITLAFADGLGGAPAYLALGVAPAAIPVGGACTLNVFPVVFLLGPFALDGAGHGAGTFTLFGAVPPNAAPGASFGLQLFALDPASPTGFSASNGMIITVE